MGLCSRVCIGEAQWAAGFTRYAQLHHHSKASFAKGASMENPSCWTELTHIIQSVLDKESANQNLPEAERPIGYSLAYRIELALKEFLAASQPGEPPQPRCPKCGNTELDARVTNDVSCGVYCRKCKRDVFVKRLEDYGQFFSPSAHSPLPTYEQAKPNIGWGWSGFRIEDEDSLKFAFNRMRDAMQKCLGAKECNCSPFGHEPSCPGVAPSGSAGQEPPYCKCDIPYEGARVIPSPRKCERCELLLDPQKYPETPPEGRAESAAETQPHEPGCDAILYKPGVHCKCGMPPVVSASPAPTCGKPR